MAGSNLQFLLYPSRLVQCGEISRVDLGGVKGFGGVRRHRVLCIIDRAISNSLRCVKVELVLDIGRRRR